jgi:anaphase-promoting complex subunit 6
MQHLQLNNLQLAEEYLLQAHGICDNDPLLLNELGVAAFEKARYTEAVHYFREAIRVAEMGEWDQHAWTVAWTNLGHAFRKMGYILLEMRLKSRQLTQAHSAFARAIKLNHRDSGLCASYALVCMILGDIDAAIVSLHEVFPHFRPRSLTGIGTNDLTC